MDRIEYANRLSYLIKLENETKDKNELIKINEEIKKLKKEFHDSRFEEEFDNKLKGMMNR